MSSFDVIVCGLGIMGSAACHALARRGAKVLGLDRFPPGHGHGSSHGESRIIRLAYFEHPSYVPLLRSAYPLWRTIERDLQQPLLSITGIAEIGRPDSELVRGTLTAARMHGLAHEVLDPAETTRRFPELRPPDDTVCVLQPDGGFIHAETAVSGLQQLARAHGANIETGRLVSAVEPQASGVRVVTDRGVEHGGAVVVAAGPWLKTLLPNLPAPIRVTRQVLAWFAPAEPSRFSPERFPVFMIEGAHGMHYGFPSIDGASVKVAKHHHQNEAVDPQACDDAVTAHDIAEIRSGVAQCVPAVGGGALARAQTCRYTMTPDGHFLIDRLEGARNVLVLSPCSGHGFKFAPVVGEIAADLLLSGKTEHDISRFALSRFAEGAPQPP